MRVLFVSSEIYPLAKTGGLADVSAALPGVLAALGVDVRLVMPGYPEALDAAEDINVAPRLPGLFPARSLCELKLPEELIGPDGIEFYGHISFLKAGIRHSDRFNTVGPSYAREILTAEFRCGLHGPLNERAGDLSGILNGIDCGVWNPATDPYLPARFEAQSMTGKHICKAELQRELGLDMAPATLGQEYHTRPSRLDRAQGQSD